MKKNGLKRKAALTLAVLGAISPVSGISPMVNDSGIVCAEAATQQYPSVFMGYVATNYEGRRQGGHDSSDSTWAGEDPNTVSVTVKWNPSANRYGVYYKVVAAHYGPWQFVGQEQDAYDNKGVSTLSYHQVNTYYVPDAGLAPSAYAVAKMLNANIESGVIINEDKLKDLLRETGIDIKDDAITIDKPIDTKDINADGKITATGDIEAGGDIHGKGNLDIDGDSHIKGNQTVDGNSATHGNQTVDGDSRVHGSEVVDKDMTIYGNTDLKGDAKVDGDLRVKGDTQLGDDKNNDKFDVWAKTHLHGDTTVGDDAKDKFVVNATSEFKADATFDKNVAIKGNLEVDGDSITHGNSTVDGDSTIHGNETIDKNLHVKGDSKVDGNSSVQGDLDVKGNTTLGDDKNSDTLDVNAKTHLHGDTTIGDDTNDKLTINATTEFGGESTFNKDVHIKGDLKTDGNSTTHGNTITDGNALIYGNAGVAQNFFVGGDAKVDGDVYGKSFNIGDEKYIDKDGINANNHKIRNVADGKIGPNSLDAVNGRQLYHTREALQHNINQVGAATAAMASLHPLDYEHDDKLSISAAMGNYKDKTALAAGVFYRPNIKSMFNLSGTLGYGDNMFGIGVTTKMGKVTEADTMTDEQLRDKVSEIHDENKELREENGKLKSEVSDLKAKDVSQENQIAALSAKNADLEKSLSDITKAYSQLMSKVDSMAAELANLKATQK